MDGTLVYDAVRDGGGWSISSIATALILVGFALMAIPAIRTIRKQPEKRTRGFVGLGMLGLLAAGVVFGFSALDAKTASLAKEDTIEGVIGSIKPKLITVGLMKVMISCADLTHCPGIAVGDYARVAYVDDSGPETDALATRIWKLPTPSRAR